MDRGPPPPGLHRPPAAPADPRAITDLTDGEGLACAAALAAQDNTLEDLDPGPAALLDPNVNLQRVTRPEFRNVRSDLCLLQLGNRGVHRCGSSVVITRTPANALHRSVGAMAPGARPRPADSHVAGRRLSVGPTLAPEPKTRRPNTPPPTPAPPPPPPFPAP